MISSIGGDGRRSAARQHAAVKRKAHQAIDQLVRQNIGGNVLGQREAERRQVPIGHEHRDDRKPAFEQPRDELLALDDELIEPPGLVGRLERSVDGDAGVVEIADRIRGMKRVSLAMPVVPAVDSNAWPSRASMAWRTDSGTGCGFCAW